MAILKLPPLCFTFRIIILSLFFISLPCLPLYSPVKRNNRPIIGILSQEVKYPKGNETAYIAASYVKTLESAGARVVPVLINQPPEYYRKLFNSINGILYPGGSASIMSSGYQRAAKAFYEMAIEANKNGDYFPVWGTCLGYEQLACLTSGKNVLSRTNTSDVPLPLVFTDATDHLAVKRVGGSSGDCPAVSGNSNTNPSSANPNSGGLYSPHSPPHQQTFCCCHYTEAKDSRMFEDFPPELMEELASEPLTANAHKWSVTVLTHNTNEELKNFYKVLSTNTDGKTEFVSTVEAYDYPFYGTQWHPEKNAFEWGKPYVPHSLVAVRTTFYMAEFFVNEARKNFHRFESEEEETKALIYNYNPVFKSPTSTFLQIYYF